MYAELTVYPNEALSFQTQYPCYPLLKFSLPKDVATVAPDSSPV